MNWLVKEEPSNYSFDALRKDGKTVWSGVRNPLGQKHLRPIQAGDAVFYYHTGSEKAIVGTATVSSSPAPESGDPSGKLWMIGVTVTNQYGTDHGFLSTPHGSGMMKLPIFRSVPR